MGKYKKGILGAFSGKVGTVVGSTWNGIEYMRSLPRASSKAPSDLQMINRAKFGLVNGFLGPISSLLNLGYKSQAMGKTGYNVAVAELITDAVTGVYPNFDVDYSKVLFSKGTLTGAYGVTAEPEPSTVRVSWVDNSDSGTAKATDKMVMLVYNPSKGHFVYNLNTGATRDSVEDTLVMPAEFVGDTVEVWVAFMTPDKKIFSTSIYAGQVLIA